MLKSVKISQNITSLKPLKLTKCKINQSSDLFKKAKINRTQISQNQSKSVKMQRI